MGPIVSDRELNYLKPVLFFEKIRTW